MDSKEKNLLNMYHGKIINYDFDENDVYAFLMLLREKFPKETPLRELGDFIGHREKDRGFIFEYLNTNKTMIGNIANNTIPPGEHILRIENVFKNEQVKNQYNKLLKEQGLSLFSTKMINGIMLCVISLFQHIKITNKKGVELGVLKFGISTSEIYLKADVNIDNKLTTTFQVLSVPNDYLVFEEVDPYDTPATLKDDYVAVIKNVDKKLVIEFN